MTDTYILGEDLDLSSLTDAFGCLQGAFVWTWRAIRRGLLPSSAPPSPPLLCIPYDIWRAVGNAFREGDERATVTTALPPEELAQAGNDVAEVLDAAGIAGRPAAETLRSLVRPEAALVESAATASTGYAPPPETDAAPRLMILGVPVADLLHGHEYLTRLYTHLWQAVIDQRVSRFIVSTAEHEGNLIAINRQVDRAIDDAVRSGTDEALIWADMPPERFLVALETIQRRMAMLPYAAEVGIDLPVDEQAVATIDLFIRAGQERAREASGAGQYATDSG